MSHTSDHLSYYWEPCVVVHYTYFFHSYHGTWYVYQIRSFCFKWWFHEWSQGWNYQIFITWTLNCSSWKSREEEAYTSIAAVWVYLWNIHSIHACAAHLPLQVYFLKIENWIISWFSPMKSCLWYPVSDSALIILFMLRMDV